MSSKGQIVIPQDMRKGMHQGDKIVIIESEGQLILKKVNKFDKQLEEDLKFAKRTEAAWKRYERGEFKTMDFDDFLKKLKNG